MSTWFSHPFCFLFLFSVQNSNLKISILSVTLFIEFVSGENSWLLIHHVLMGFFFCLWYLEVQWDLELGQKSYMCRGLCVLHCVDDMCDNKSLHEHVRKHRYFCALHLLQSTRIFKILVWSKYLEGNAQGQWFLVLYFDIFCLKKHNEKTCSNEFFFK